jgi:hypothetical protein
MCWMIGVHPAPAAPAVAEFVNDWFEDISEGCAG